MDCRRCYFVCGIYGFSALLQRGNGIYGFSARLQSPATAFQLPRLLLLGLPHGLRAPDGVAVDEGAPRVDVLNLDKSGISDDMGDY
jgi:hypothetical protein